MRPESQQRAVEAEREALGYRGAIHGDGSLGNTATYIIAYKDAWSKCPLLLRQAIVTRCCVNSRPMPVRDVAMPASVCTDSQVTVLFHLSAARLSKRSIGSNILPRSRTHMAQIARLC